MYLKNLTFCIPIFHPITHPPTSTPFSIEKHPILLKLGTFNSSLLLIHPIYVIWVPLFLMKNHRLLYQSLQKGRQINIRIPWQRSPQGLGDCKFLLTRWDQNWNWEIEWICSPTIALNVLIQNMMYNSATLNLLWLHKYTPHLRYTYKIILSFIKITCIPILATNLIYTFMYSSSCYNKFIIF